MINLYYPNFFDDFTCKCGNCRRTCCRDDWVIGLTKQEYEDNLNHVHGICRWLAEKRLHRLNSGTESLYAACSTDENGVCKLLTETGLCSWQLLNGCCVGAVCDEFPRFHLKYLDDEYIYPTLACEAVVEAIWQQKENFTLISKDALLCKVQNVTINTDALEKRPVFKFYSTLTGAGLKLLQMRRFSLDNRMVLLANLACLVDYYEKKGETELIPQIVESFMQEQNFVAVIEKYAEYSISPAALLTVNCETMMRQLDLPRFFTQARKVLEGLGFELIRQSNSDFNVEVFFKHTEKYLHRKEAMKPFLEKNAVFFEKLLICEFLRGMTFFTEPDIFSSFCVFNCWYALLKGTLCGLFDGEPDNVELVDAIVILQRMFTHQAEEYGHTLRLLKNVQMEDLGSMVALAKG